MARRDGNRIYFDRAETESIAAGAKAIAITGPLIPDPSSASIIMQCPGLRIAGKNGTPILTAYFAPPEVTSLGRSLRPSVS
jgi:hypothetical protein